MLYDSVAVLSQVRSGEDLIKYSHTLCWFFTSLKEENMLWIGFFCALLISTDCISIGTIKNAAIIKTTVHLQMNGTKDQCTCKMLRSDGSISGFNYFPVNVSCHLFYNYSVTSDVRANTNCSIVFLKLPSISISTAMTTTVEPLST